MVDEMSEMLSAATPTVGSTVVREAFDSGFTLYFSDHSSISVAGAFVVRDTEGESRTLTASPAGLVEHASRLVALIGMEVGAVDSADGMTTLSFTSGINLIVP